MTAILEPQVTRPAEHVPEVPVQAMPAAVEPRPVRATVATAPRPRPVLTPAGVRLLGVALIGLFALGVAVQPEPDGPNPVAPWWANALNVVIQVGLLAVLAGIVGGRRWSVWAGLGTGASLLTLSITCPIDGHHTIAAWWFVQMAVGVAMTLLPAGVLRRTQAASKAG